MIDDLFAADIDTAARDRIARPLPPKPAESKFSAWSVVTALPRGVTEATAQVLASTAEVLGGFGQVLGAYPEAAGYNPTGAARQEADAQRQRLLTEGVDMSSDAGDALRAGGRTYRPDPATAHAAEQVVYGFSRGAAKVVGGALAAGPAGVLAAGAEEGMSAADDLRLQGVDVGTRTMAGAVQGAGLALAALPLIGQTKLATAGLYAAGGPGGFMAQQAMTREILQGAGYDKIGAQFDPFDPVGLAVSALLPAGFTAYGLRRQQLQRAADSLPDLPPRAGAVPPADPAAPAPFPSRLSPVADAVRAYPTEAVDAARVVLLAERRAAANPGRDDDTRAMDQHEAALTRAEDQIAAGEPVQVADLAPAPRVLTVETPEFRAFFNESRTVTPEGAPMVLYHATSTDFPGFAENPRGIFFAERPAEAEPFSRIRDGSPVMLPVYVAIKNPWTLISYGDDVPYSKMVDQSVEALKAKGYDGMHDPERGVWIAFAPEQIKSAIGNSGAFDPTTGSLTDSPYATWADQIAAAIREMQAQARPTDAPTPTQAANPETAAPARGAGEPPAAAGAAEPGRPAGVEAAGVAAAREAEIAKLPDGTRQLMRDKFAAADQAKPAFDATIEAMAAEAGAAAKLADIKGPVRSVAKVLGDYNGDPAQIKDLLRATIEVDSVDAARRAVALVFERFPVLPTGRRNLLDPGRQPVDGYRDAKFNVMLGDGVIAEVQINVPQMLAAKKNGGHDLYQQREALTREWRGKILPDEVQAQVDDLNIRMRALYDAAWIEATNAPNSAAVTGAPLRLADSGSNVRGGSVSQAVENGTPGASGNSDTGMPSTSNNSALGPNAGSFMSTSAPIIGANPDGGGLRGPSGSGTAAITERGLTVPLRYRLAEAGDLTTSHTNDLTANPAFPAELQPRDRARAASAEQISRIENAIKPALLGESVKASDGAPIVGPDAVVESGNARTIALRRAYESGKADAYRAWLADNAERFGLTRQQVEGMRQPVLVRERLGDVDRAEFARQANESAVAAMSPTEQAMSDARRITDLSGLVPNDDGTINMAQSADFVRQFVGQVAPTERGTLLQANGQLSQAGMNRLRNAVFAKAYGDADILAMLTESTDANVRNILAGMLRAAPDVAKLADLAQAGARQDADIAGPLVEAVRLFSQLRSEGRTVQQFLAQGNMFGDGLAPEIQSMLEAVSLNARAPKRIAEMIGGMVDNVNAMGDARQMGMFGDAPTGAEAVAGAAERAVMESRLSMAAEKFPALEVMVDGMEKPMPMAEFLAAAKKEADELAADAPLMQVAVECAMLNGAG